MQKRFISISGSSVSYTHRRRRLFVSFLILPRKHLGIILRALGMALRPKLLLLQKNGDGICKFFSLFKFYRVYENDQPTYICSYEPSCNVIHFTFLCTPLPPKNLINRGKLPFDLKV